MAFMNLMTCIILQALYGVYAKDVHVRMACLNAIKCIPAVSGCSLPQNVEVATSIWIALHDKEKVKHAYYCFAVNCFKMYLCSHCFT